MAQLAKTARGREVSGMRPLTDGEWTALSSGLAAALHKARAAPRIMPRASPLARIAALWRRETPIMALGQTIWWADAPDDLSRPGLERQMAVLQHELQHVLEFASGELSLAGYALLPFNWRYGYSLGPDTRWTDLGAEQRARAVQDYWLAERELPGGEPSLERLRRLIPWAT
jgi:hypothetical protein